MIPQSTLVLGVGNTLLTDEGIGIHVVAWLRAHHGERADMALLDGGTLSFTLADDIGRYGNLVVVDAARLDAEPGTVRVFENEAMDARLRGGLASVHEVGLSDLMDIARLTDTLPRRRALVGIQPDSLEWGDLPTPIVAESIPSAAQAVLDLVERWKQEAESLAS
ncbi:MAG: HyaD/HybD family hydrogenase maturation endopeptidase [Pseudomonadota bacterium]